MREKYRSQWLKVRLGHPGLKRKQLIDKANFLYLWLKRNDPEWVEHKIPPQTGKQTNREYLNWEKIDEELSKKIEVICNELLCSKSFPIRVGITEIINRSGCKVWIDKRSKKLPKTSQVIDKYLESFEDFMLRKVEWASERFIEETNVPSINQFKRRAIVNNKTSNDSKDIQQAIEEAFIQINKSVKPS